MAQLIPCITPNPPTEIGVTIPGVGKIKAFKQKLEEAPSPADFAAAALGQIQPALAPIMQILRVVEVIVAIIDLLKSIKNPFKVAKKLKKVLSAFQQLATFVPGISHAKMIRDILDIVIELLRGFTGAIDRWVSEILLISQSLRTNEVLNDPEMTIAINCSKKKLIEIQGGTTATLKDVGSILGVVARVLDIIKSFVPGGPAKTIVEAIKQIALLPDVLLGITDLIGTAQSPIEFEIVLKQLEHLENLLKGTTRVLEAASGTLTSIVGK